MPKDGQMYYDLLNMAYVQEKETNLEDIADNLNISRMTFYRTKQKAIEQLSVLMWNTPGGSLGSWAEVAFILSGVHSN